MYKPIACAAVLLCLLTGCAERGADAVAQRQPMDGAFLSIHELQVLIASGELDYAQITSDALARIQTLDDEGPQLNAVIETAPAALEQARRLGASDPGMLAGVPVLVKANIDTAPPMRTHAGSLAVVDHVAADDAQLVTALRREGAIVVGKANLSEWANFRGSPSVSGWSSIGGQTKNPHVLDRNPCGSSSGSAVAVAAGMVPLAIGTETHGSIVCPAGVNGIVGLKPTLGLVSRDGIIPIAFSQDTAGPMARSVRDVALALQVIAEPGVNDPHAQGHPGRVDYVSGLAAASLDGVRVGVWRAYRGADQAPRVAEIFDGVAANFTGAGAQLVDPVGLYVDTEVYEASYQVLLHEFKQGINAYFGGTPSLTELIAYNQANAKEVMPWFGQSVFVEAEQSQLDAAAVAAALAQGQGAIRQLLDEVFDKFQLDIVIAPTNAPAWPIDYVAGDRFGVSSSGLGAISGRPAITLPAGQIHGLPVGVSLIGKMWGDAELLQIAAALEKLLPAAPRPTFKPSLEP